ncbi:MAG: ATP:cob(I)alamin adenosyltransferase, partial [Planctomycetota bacterium]
MKLYTRSGDDGFTQGPGGKHVRKNDPVIAALGAVDELNAHVGLCLEGCERLPQTAEALRAVQPELFALGALLAGRKTDAESTAPLGDAAVERIERHIDAVAGALPELKHFIIPGGCELAC